MADESVDQMRIEEFLVIVNHYTTHVKSTTDLSKCGNCTWVLPKLDALQKKMIDYLQYRKDDEDTIEWNTLIIELLDMPDEHNEEDIHSKPSPAKKRKSEEVKPKIEAKIEKKVAREETKLMESSDKIDKAIESLVAETENQYDPLDNVEMDSWDDEEDDSGEDQPEDEEDELMEQEPENPQENVQGLRISAKSE